ncbi:MAG: hypothetical protein JWN60_1085 [Acidobacteria bacterium]|nr:hypothetical protein [Acidobacteriota bacterium]
MPFLKTAGVAGTILVVLALIITLLKQIIAFIAFITGAIKILIVLAFVVLIIGVGLMVLRGFNQKRKEKS